MKFFNLVLLPALLLLGSCSGNSPREPAADSANQPPQEGPPDLVAMAALDHERGVPLVTEKTSAGYVIFSSLSSDEVYMMDKNGKVVHVWNLPYAAAAHYLTDEGYLYVNARDPEAPRFSGGGMAGKILKLDWDGNVLWEYTLANDEFLQHHDIAVMPNGNILATVWQHKSKEEAAASGVRPHIIPAAGLWPDKIIEIKPDGATGGEIVWEWDYWDHIVQEDFPELPNYGIVADHPRKIHVNFKDSLHIPTQEEFNQQQAMGMLAANASIDNSGSDMFHTNALNYNASLDQIAVSMPDWGEIWIIDHSLDTETARTEAGDLMYRWGNPQKYHRGGPEDQQLMGQHDVRWIPEGYPGEGKIMIFNNVSMGERGPFSQVVIIDPAPSETGGYILPEGGAFGPGSPDWTYDANDSTDLLAPFISSAHRMKNGNTLVNFGPQGKFVEVSPQGDVVWEYWSPYIGDVKLAGGIDPQPVGPFKYAVFRVTHVNPEHPALQGKALEPLDEQPAHGVLPAM